MSNLLTRTIGDRDLRGRLVALYMLLIVANLAIWAWVLYIFRDHPVMLGTALLAYSFGLRHAVDADHIAAIDRLLARLFRPLFRLVTESWHMLPLGFLFGLGFDTATEVALLGISATQAGQGMSIWSIMVFPALFAAGMSLIDTTDGVLMLGRARRSCSGTAGSPARRPARGGAAAARKRNARTRPLPPRAPLRADLVGPGGGQQDGVGDRRLFSTE